MRTNPGRSRRVRTGASVGVALVAPVLLLAVLSLFQRHANARPLIVVPVTPPSAEPAAPQRTQQDSSSVALFLTSVRGATPVICALAARSLGNQGGWLGSHSGTEVAWGHDPQTIEVLRWAFGETRNASSAVQPLLAALAEGDPCASRLAAQLLGRSREPRAMQGLLAALADPTARVRATAALGLGYSDLSAAVDPLIGTLRDSDAGVRASSAWALGSIESRRAVPALIAALKDVDPVVRRSSAQALGEIEDPAAIPALAALLREDRDAEVRRAAAWALGEISG
jgi:hypothetical protein